MRLAVIDFKGEAPKRAARLLPANFAQKAVNTRLESGTLGPARATAAIATLGAAAQTIYRYGGAWLSWDAEVNAARGPIATERLYFTGDGVPQMRIGSSLYDLALPAPADDPIPSVASGTVDTEIAEDVLFAYTYVTSLGEESAPSPLSAPIAWSAGVVIRLSGLSAPPAGRLITKMRIYRSVTSTTGTTDLYFVDEISTATSYDHDLALAPIQDAAGTVHFSTPPDDLEGLITLPNGMMAGFVDKSLYFCEPYQPHAWPQSYSLATDYPIVGLAAFGSYLAVLTTGTPYRVQGSHPENMTMEKIEQDLPCLAARGIVDLGYSAVYPSSEGLVMMSPSGAQVISRPLMSFEQWTALEPESIVAARYNGRYWFSFDGQLGDTDAAGALIDLTGEQPYLIRTDVNAIATYQDVGDGRLYYLADATHVREWDALGATSHLEQTWRSKVFVLPTAGNFGCMLVEGSATNDPASFAARIYADGSLIHTETTWGVPTRLPGGFLASRWEIELETDVDVEAITLAGDFEELVQP